MLAILVGGFSVLGNANLAELTGAVPIDDGYTDTTRPTPHDWNADLVPVGAREGARHVGYLKFDIGKLPGDKLPRLEFTVDGDAGTLEFYATEVGWSEATLSRANAPAKNGLLTVMRIGSGQHRMVVDFPDLLGEEGIYSFAVVRRDLAGRTELASGESGARTSPRLWVVEPGQPPSPAAERSLPPWTPTPSPSIPPDISATSRPEPSPTATPSETPTSGPAGPCSVSAKLVPSCGVWWGQAAYPQSGESFDQAIIDVEQLLQRPGDIAHYYHRGQSVLFPTQGEMYRVNQPGRNRLLLLNWRPGGLTWRAVADGAADGYLVRLADHIRTTHPDPFFLLLNHEMEDEVDPTAGSGQTAADFAAFFRHVVKLLRANGADNIVTVVGYTSTPHWGEQPWFETLYPGDDVVDWIAEDPYSVGGPPIWRTDFAGMVDRVTDPDGSWPGFYTWATREHPGKPIMLAEWGVIDPDDDPDYKPNFFRTAGAQLKEFPKLKALVYWNAYWDAPFGDMRVNSSARSLAAIREFVSLPTLTAPGRYYLN